MAYRIGAWNLRLMTTNRLMTTDEQLDEKFNDNNSEVVDIALANFSNIEETLNNLVPEGYYFKIED